MDSNCYINCPELETQSIAEGNLCKQTQKVPEEIDGWLSELPGGMMVS